MINENQKESPQDEVQVVKTEVEKSKTKTTFILDQEICIGCRGCVDICPFGIFEQVKGKAYLVENQCVNCTDDNSCVEICPTNAVDIVKTF
jgi:Fe-S-cluster-containing hydrogenase component 2